jgi:rSAM/selenodomain-associated transferase 1
MNDLRRPTLVIMVRAPVAGAVKTRLAREIGTMEALRFYRSATTSLLRRLGRDPRWRTVLAVTPDHARDAGFWPARLPRMAQGRGDLGARMRRCLDQVGPGPVLLVGSDIPGIMPCHIADASRLLRSHRLVFGPAEDGGFWLVGRARSRCPPGLFAEARWSGPHALADCVGNAPLAPAFAARLRDVDTREDWLRWRRDSR